MVGKKPKLQIHIAENYTNSNKKNFELSKKIKHGF